MFDTLGDEPTAMELENAETTIYKINLESKATLLCGGR
jgi:hypothetical protein